MTLKAGMRQLSSALRAAFEIEHHGAKGEGREEALAAGIRPFIPRRFDLSTGEVVNSTGGRSQQQDLIVSDSYLGTPFISQGRIGVHPVESVVATVQVKSWLDSSEARSGVRNLASVKQLLPYAKHRLTRVEGGRLLLGQTMKPFGGLVAYKPEGTWRVITQAYAEENVTLPPEDRVNVLLVLDDFVVCWIADDGTSVVTNPAMAKSARVFRAGQDSILFFYIVMMEALRVYEPPRLNLTAYFGASGVSWEQFDVHLPQQPPEG